MIIDLTLLFLLVAITLIIFSNKTILIFEKKNKKIVENELVVDILLPISNFLIIEGNNNCSLFIDGKEIKGKKEKEYKLFNYELLSGEHNIKIICNSTFVKQFHIVKLNSVKKGVCYPYDTVNLGLKDMLEEIDEIEPVPNNNLIDYRSDREIIIENVDSVLKYKKGSCGAFSLIFYDTLCENSIYNDIMIGFIYDGKNVNYHSWNVVYSNDKEIFIDPANKGFLMTDYLSPFYKLNEKILEKRLEIDGKRFKSITPILFSDGLVEIKNNKLSILK
jgi:hypothetical protein